MLNVYCRFICHHELNCDLFLSFRTPHHAARSVCRAREFAFLPSKHDTRRMEKTNKIHAEKSNSTWCDRLNKNGSDRQENSFEKWTQQNIDEIGVCVSRSLCVCVCVLWEWVSEWADAETRDYFEESFGRHKIRLWLQLGPITQHRDREME